MSERVLARCGGLAGRKTDRGYERVFDLRQTGPGQNVDFRITNITSQIVKDVSQVGRDLLDIATYVYVLDSSVSRGGPTDVYGSQWVRDFTLRIPVRDVALWNTSHSELEHLLRYLTDDEYTFEFVSHPGDAGQQWLEFESYRPFSMADCVCLFSGGADSLAGAVSLVRDGRKPLLVSHRSVGILDRRQKDLQDALHRMFPEWDFPHLSLWARRKDLRPYEHTQRSRSFLFSSLAAAVANELDIEEIFIPENGVVSLNLPKLEQAVGARASRSTQPRFVTGFKELARLVFGRPIQLNNPFLLCTKAEVLKELNSSGHPELLEASVSCARTMGRTKAQPHCGECSQCVDRRFSSVAAGLGAYDPKERYEKDIFVDELTEEGRKQLEAYVRAARRFEDMLPDEFFTKHRQVADAACYMEGTVSQASETLYELHRRFARQTLDVIETQLTASAPTVARGKHPPGGLLALMTDQRLNKEPAAVMAERITRVLRRDLPLRFRSGAPASERELQNAMEAALTSAEERLRREGPAVSYSVVETTPDFSSLETRGDLYVEAKLVKDRSSLRYAVKSIGQASSYYVNQGAWVLFIVYDTDRHIADDEEFSKEFEQKGSVQVSVIR
jgi:7-cyano-7-deazaguanine synthase in queuosine biosynthesis